MMSGCAERSPKTMPLKEVANSVSVIPRCGTFLISVNSTRRLPNVTPGAKVVKRRKMMAKKH